MEWLETEAVLTLEYSKVSGGGLRSDSALLANVDLTLAIDTEAAGLWAGGNAFFYILGNDGRGGPPSALVGDVQGTSNIEAPDTWKLYEAWYEHRFFDGYFSLLGGLHDYNGEFDVLEYGQLFTNSSFGIGPDISQVGPSIFPTTALGLRLRMELSPSSYLLAAAYDGVPGDPDNVNRKQLSFAQDDGQFYALELGITGGAERYYKLAIGGWYRSDFADFAGREKHNSGTYLLAECATWEGGPGLFLRVGTAHDRRNQVESYVGAGFNWMGLVPGRPDDSFGAAFAYAGFGDEYLDRPANAESAVEFTYLAEIHGRIALQPFLQLVFDPGSEPDIDDAVVLGLRVSITLW